jgi:hypothetical protein
MAKETVVAVVAGQQSRNGNDTSHANSVYIDGSKAKVRMDELTAATALPVFERWLPNLLRAIKADKRAVANRFCLPPRAALSTCMNLSAESKNPQ